MSTDDAGGPTVAPWRRVVGRASGLVGVVFLAGGLVSALLTAVVVFTPLQEVSFRWMGFAGLALIVAVGAAVAASAGAVLVSARIGGRRRWAVLVAGLTPWLLVLVIAGPTLRGMVAPERHDIEAGSFTLLAQNVWYEGEDPARTVRLLLERDADVLVLTEFTQAHADALDSESVSQRYPYRWELPEPDGGGLALLSSLPFDEPVELPLWTPAIQAELEVGDATVTLIATHPVSPSDNYSIVRWRDDYDDLVRIVADAGPRTVVAGDMNATTTHRRLRELMSVGELRDAQQAGGGGFRATWPVATWAPPVLPLDHILVGPGLGIAEFEVLGDVGSDHFGVEARLGLRDG